MIRGEKVETLVDSGASISMVGKRLFEVIPGLKQHLQPCEQKVRAVAINGEILDYPAYLDIEINIEGRSIPIRALYSPKINYELILGFNFLKEHSCSFDFEQMKIRFPTIGIVRTRREIVLEPRTETVAMGFMEDSMGRGEGIIKTHTILQHMNLLVANSIIKLGKTMPIKILNGSNMTKVIKPGTRLAMVTRLGVCDFIHPTTDDSQMDNQTTNMGRHHLSNESPTSNEVVDHNQRSSSTLTKNTDTDILNEDQFYPSSTRTSSDLDQSEASSNHSTTSSNLNNMKDKQKLETSSTNNRNCYTPSTMTSSEENNASVNMSSISTIQTSSTNNKTRKNDSSCHPGNMPRTEYNKMFKLDESEFTSTQKDDLLNLLWDFNDIFAKPGQQLGCAEGFEFKIKLIEGAREFKAKPYRSNPKFAGRSQDK